MSDLPDWRSRVAPAQRRILERAVDAARDTGIRLFIVGGPVRDLALGIPFVDIDLVVENGGESLAARLAEALEAEVQSFPRFLTWRLDAGDGAPIDITTARTESYEHPGALPVVAQSTLREDLFRRDFAANSVALDLLTNEITDPTGGLADIRAGIMRVLHSRSFIDDPTRMLRGIRIATRLGFQFEPATADLIRESAAECALETVSRERVWREIFIATKDARPAATLVAMRRWGLLDPFLLTSSGNDDLLQQVDDHLSIAERIDREVTYVGILTERAEQPGRSLEGAGFSNSRTNKTVTLVDDARLLAGQLEQARTPVEQLRLCARASDETRAVASAMSEAAAAKIRQFRDYPRLALGFRGDELGLPAGPHIARALEATREAVYLELVPPEKARAFARRAGLKYLDAGNEEDPDSDPDPALS